MPNYTVKLSENIAGIILNQEFSLSFINNDGFFDKGWDIFNTPAILYKSIVDKPEYSDFKMIRSGIVKSIRKQFNNFLIDVSDLLATFEESVCTLIDQKDFAFTLDEEAVGKPIPVIFGIEKINVQKLGNNVILIAEYSRSIELFNKDGQPVSFDILSYKPSLIQVSEDDYEDADYAIVEGYENNKIGEIIKNLTSRNNRIIYSSSFWNTDESDRYISHSPVINIMFSGGDIKKAVDDTLKNDMAYLIQQTDGKLNIRKWGESYKKHYLEPWQITKEFEIDYSKAVENYFSTCCILYDKDKNFIFDNFKNEAELRYRNLKTKTYETDLINFSAAENLAVLLGKRYIFMKPVIKLSLGTDTSSYELLHTVNIHLNINNRLFTEYENYVIIEINHAQDVLTLEAVD